MDKEKIKYCKCGCGGIPKPGNDYIYGHNRRGVILSDVTKKKMSVAKMGREVSGVTKEKISESQMGNKNRLGHKHSDATKKNMAIAHLKRYEDPLEREKQREGTLKRYEDPLEREKTSITGKKYWEDPENRILHSCRLLGITREDWDGFGSTYCELWNEELREYIRDKYNRVCFICGKTEEENGRKHDVHHIDYNKDCGCDETECKLVPLCRSCHAYTTFGDRKMWEDLIMKMLEDVN